MGGVTQGDWGQMVMATTRWGTGSSLVRAGKKAASKVANKAAREASWR